MLLLPLLLLPLLLLLLLAPSGRCLDVNVFQTAGVRLGDLIVSVDNVVAETPRLLAQGLREAGLSQSGKLVVVKVCVLFCGGFFSARRERT